MGTAQNKGEQAKDNMSAAANDTKRATRNAADDTKDSINRGIDKASRPTHALVCVYVCGNVPVTWAVCLVAQMCRGFTDRDSLV